MYNAGRLAERGQETMSGKSSTMRAKSDADRDRQTASPLGRGDGAARVRSGARNVMRRAPQT